MWWKAFCHRIRPQNFAQELHGKLPLAIDAEFNETLVPWEQFVKPICCQHPTSTKSQSVSFNLCSMCMVRSRLSNAGLWQLHQAQNSEELYEGVCERVLQPFAVALLQLFCTPSMTIILTMGKDRDLAGKHQTALNCHVIIGKIGMSGGLQWNSEEMLFQVKLRLPWVQRSQRKVINRCHADSCSTKVIHRIIRMHYQHCHITPDSLRIFIHYA